MATLIVVPCVIDHIARCLGGSVVCFKSAYLTDSSVQFECQTQESSCLIILHLYLLMNQICTEQTLI
jgi:hypothetical protein